MTSLVCRGRRIRRLLIASLTALTVAGLAGSVRPAPAGAVVADPIMGTNGAPVPRLEWGPCPASSPEEAEFLKDYQCSTAEVPLSYRDPHGQSVELALGRLPAADPAHRLGTLFWNPGGPGGSGRIPPLFSQKLHQRFDLVGFDPRGVAASMQLRCFDTNEQALRLFGWEFPITLAQERRVIELTGRGTRQCARNGGPLLEHMATADVARDLDLLRQAVGDEQLTYLGFSYGTHIGTVYANLFPDRVRALTLDGVIDPIEWTTGATPADAEVPVEYRAGSFYGSYAALQTFLNACAGDARCAFREPGRDLLRKYDTLLQRLRRRPVQLTDPSGQPVTVTYQVAVGFTLGALYDPSASPLLADALQQAWLATEQRSRARGSATARPRCRPALLAEPPGADARRRTVLRDRGGTRGRVHRQRQPLKPVGVAALRPTRGSRRPLLRFDLGLLLVALRDVARQRPRPLHRPLERAHRASAAADRQQSGRSGHPVRGCRLDRA